MKEDVLEQVVDDWMQHRGFFTRHNIRFKPSPEAADYVPDDDRVPSDVDILGIDPTASDDWDAVWVVSCKSWQSGFNATAKLAELRGEKKNPKRETWRHFRELWVPKWSQAFIDEVERLTGQRRFSYWIAVTRLTGDSDAWSAEPTFQQNLEGNPVRFLTLEMMWTQLVRDLTTTPAASEIGRLAQLLKAARLTPS